MTDDLMDARLRSAGERWRATHAEPAVVADEPLDLAEPSRPHRHRLTWTVLASAAVIAAALVAGLVVLGRGGGGTPEPSGRLPLAGTVWRVVSFGPGAAGEDGRGWNAVLAIVDGRLVADDGCTLLTATTRVDGDRLRITGRELRDESCVDGSPQVFARTGAAVMRDGATFSIRGDRLTVRHDHQAAMNLVAAPPGTPAPTLDWPTLTGANWRLVSVTDGSGRQHLLDSDAGADLRIDHGRLTAGDTCNTLSATATRTDAGFRLAQVATTEIGCVSSTVPSIIDRVLTGAISTTLRDEALTITKPGAGHLDYVWSPQSTDASPLLGRTWRATIVTGARADVTATLRIDGSRLTGTDGCTRLDGVARVTPGLMTITGTPAAETCSPQAATIASFLGQKVTFWRIQDGRLVLFGGGGQGNAIVFTTAVPPSAIDGTWRLTTVEQGGTARSSAGLTLTIDRGAVTASAHCLVRHGRVQAETIVLDSGNDATALCLSALDPVVVGTFATSVTDGQLHLTKGSTTLVFEHS